MNELERFMTRVPIAGAGAVSAVDEAREALREHAPGLRLAYIDDFEAAVRAETLDVARLARAMHTHHIGDFHRAGEGWCGEEAEAVAREYAAMERDL